MVLTEIISGLVFDFAYCSSYLFLAVKTVSASVAWLYQETTHYKYSKYRATYCHVDVFQLVTAAIPWNQFLSSIAAKTETIRFSAMRYYL